MVTWLQDHQLNIMLILGAICVFTAFLSLMTKSLHPRRKYALCGMQISAALMLFADRFCYMYRGDLSTTGYYMVRICNFTVFFMLYSLIFWFCQYLGNLYRTDGEMEKKPPAIYVSSGLCVLSAILLIINIFTGFFYYIDENNCYQRADSFWVCYILPLMATVFLFACVIKYRRHIQKQIFISLLLFSIVPSVASLMQLFLYGLSLMDISVVGMAVVVYVFALLDLNNAVERASRLEVEYYKQEQLEMQRLFEQTTQALANAIDAKDKYTHGHSNRVAMYSKMIAQALEKSEEECDEIYYAALLHDVGKIGIPDQIINKEGKLTDEEFEAIRQHPVIGMQILSKISESPYLSIGAHYHHERYDGKGYPDRLKGDDIPEIARIIAVADAYDAMTSKRSYRDPIPQHKAREEFIKGSGTQFDPKFAKIMQYLIDMDPEYRMKEQDEKDKLAGNGEIACSFFAAEVSDGIVLTPNITHISLNSEEMSGHNGFHGRPIIILFDSLDGHYYDDPRKKKDLVYFEYGQIEFDGKTTISGARKVHTNITDLQGNPLTEKKKKQEAGKITHFEIDAVKFEDHLLIHIKDDVKIVEVTIALPDSTRFAYIGLTGEQCILKDISVRKEETPVGPDHIQRIAEKISFINGPSGDIPNIQVDGYRYAATEGIPVTDGMEISFHSTSLPTARLVWHCAYVDLFYSDDKQINGPGYREYALIRLDGENWEPEDFAENKMSIYFSEEFEGWDVWRKKNKEGIDCKITFSRKGNVITSFTQNLGITVKSILTILDGHQEIYAALTGDQCAITNIRIKK
ncbi:MAG: HD domain-containing protein [Lachnospiraceae bacterium]|nr:HD domain-containing protein [Lachnospiraceae bacterium]